MKPREMYSGAAPAAMGMMGQGLTEVGANIGNIIQQGYAQAGQAIGQGLKTVGEAYGQYKSAKSSNDIFKIMVDDPQYRDLIGIARGPEGDADAEGLKKNLDMMIKAHGQVGALQFSKTFLDPIMKDVAMAREYGFKKDIATSLAPVNVDLKNKEIEKLNAEIENLRKKYPDVNLPSLGGGLNLDSPAIGKPPESIDQPASGSADESGIIDGELPLAPEPKRKTTSLVIPKSYLDQFPSTQKKTRRPYRS